MNDVPCGPTPIVEVLGALPLAHFGSFFRPASSTRQAAFRAAGSPRSRPSVLHPRSRRRAGFQRGAPLRGNPDPRKDIPCITSSPPGSAGTAIRSAAGNRSTMKRSSGTSRRSSPARRMTAVPIAMSMSPPSTLWRGYAGRDGRRSLPFSRFPATAAATATPSTCCGCGRMTGSAARGRRGHHRH